MQGPAILFAEMTPEPEWEDRFNRWCDRQHIPGCIAAPGFLGARRYRDAEKDGYLVVFELESVDAPGPDAFEQPTGRPDGETRWMMANLSGLSRYVCHEVGLLRRDGLSKDPLAAPVLYSVFYSVPDDRAAEFDEWYTTEHARLLLGNPGCLAVRRFAIHDSEPEPWTHLALNYLAGMDALDSDEHRAALATAWHDRLSEEPWFRGSSRVYVRHGEPFSPG